MKKPPAHFAGERTAARGCMYAPPASTLRFHCTATHKRVVFGRVEHRISPAMGDGKMWVSVDSITWLEETPSDA